LVFPEPTAHPGSGVGLGVGVGDGFGVGFAEAVATGDAGSPVVKRPKTTPMTAKTSTDLIINFRFENRLLSTEMTRNTNIRRGLCIFVFSF
jgi:hypothetical protein